MKKHLIHNHNFEIIKLYEDGYSARQLGILFGASGSSICNLLKLNNIVVRNPYDFSITLTNNRKTFYFNKSFFLTESNELAYMMGFALADGNLWLSKKHPSARFSFSIHEKDSIILDYFQKITSYNKPIVPDTIGNKKIKLFFTDPMFRYKSFNKWGLVPNKTYYPTILDINELYLKPFIIGYIDGDGSITWKKGKGYKFNIVGNKKTIDQIIYYIQILNKDHKFDWHFEDPPNKVWKRVILTNKNQVLQLVKTLEPWNYFYLPRKWNSVIEHIKENNNDKNI